MSTAVEWILGICTVAGGIAAVWYFWENYRAKEQWTEKDKLTNSTWWEGSDLRKQYQANGFTHFHWSNAAHVPERIAEGHEVVFESDKPTKTRHRIVNKSGQVLMAKKQ